MKNQSNIINCLYSSNIELRTKCITLPKYLNLFYSKYNSKLLSIRIKYMMWLHAHDQSANAKLEEYKK